MIIKYAMRKQNEYNDGTAQDGNDCNHGQVNVNLNPNQPLMITVNDLNEINHILDSNFYQQLLSLNSKLNHSIQQHADLDNLCDRSLQGINIEAEDKESKESEERLNHNNNNDIIVIDDAEKIWKCKMCNYCAKHRSTLAIHERVHTGEKPYQCDICYKGFARKDYLTKHRRYHTGEKPYKCNICKRAFKQRSGMTSHIKKFHDIIVKEESDDTDANNIQQDKLKT